MKAEARIDAVDEHCHCCSRKEVNFWRCVETSLTLLSHSASHFHPEIPIMSLMFLRGTSAGATDQQHKHEERRSCHRQVEQLTGDKRQRRWGPDIHVSFNKCSEARATVEQRWMGTSKKFTGGNGITVGTVYQRGGGPLWKYNHATTRGAAVGFTPSQLGSDVALNYDRKKKNFNHLCSLGFIVLTATSPPPGVPTRGFVFAYVVWFAFHLPRPSERTERLLPPDVLLQSFNYRLTTQAGVTGAEAEARKWIWSWNECH